jgi:ribosomal protein L11 methyltransferase
MTAAPRTTTVCTFEIGVKMRRNSNSDTTEQTAHKIADHFAEHFAGEDVGISLTDASGGRWQVALYFLAPPDQKAVREAVAAIAGPKAAAALRLLPLAATDWVRESLMGLAPVAAGRFIVHGAHDGARVPVNRIGIEIEAALAFGTGHHGTTRGCLLALDGICKSRSSRLRAPRVLDLGAGSGVLAIAAARALRGRVLATDIDAEAVRTARANARRNRAGAMIDVARADGVAARRLRRRAAFDLIFANILLGSLLRLAAPIRRLAAPGARVVLSGLLAAQSNAVIAAYRPLSLERRIDLDGWTTLVFVRRMRRRAIVGD